ncbi:hypothetical protein, partial [Kaarinaea lacus]
EGILGPAKLVLSSAYQTLLPKVKVSCRNRTDVYVVEIVASINENNNNIFSHIPPETGSIIQQDPQIDFTSGNYAIPLTSPAAYHGREVPGTISTDYNNVPFISPMDIGAFKA